MNLQLGMYTHQPLAGNVSPFTGQIYGQRHFTPVSLGPFSNPANIGVGTFGASNQARNLPTPPGTLNGGLITSLIPV